MKLKVTATISLLTFSLILVLGSCTKDEVDSTVKSYTDAEYAVISASLNIPQNTEEYKNPELPDHFSSGGFIGNTISNHGATLGRVLFFDKRLSANNSISCANCHEQKNAFADLKALSTGFEGGDTERNSLALGNVRFYYHDRGFFWDERANSVEDQVRQTVANHIEMGMDMEAIPEKLSNEGYYKILFKKAYSSEEITSDKIANALAQYVRSIISFDSKFDQAIAKRSENSFFNINSSLADLTAAENKGMNLYAENCSSCHGNIIFLGRATANNGLDVEYADNGVGELVNNPELNGVFKVPFLRNIEVTGPYMHDGRFETLEEVIDHYSTGIQNHPNLDFQLKDGNGPKQMNFTNQEKEDLIAFLKTLTDVTFTEQEKYFDPFK